MFHFFTRSFMLLLGLVMAAQLTLFGEAKPTLLPLGEKVMGTTEAINQQDSLALVALYNATNGKAWTFSTNWLIGPVKSWHGITVANSRVTELNLNTNNLSGQLPTEIKDLTALTSIKMYSNQLSGALPSGIGMMFNLTVLNLNSNRFSGSLPAELGQLTNLVDLQLSSNTFSGSLPSEMGQLKKLKTLYLHYNQLTGFIPSEFGGMTSLERLYLNNNLLSGDIPLELGLLANLQLLMLNNNNLTGSIPFSLGALSKLTYLQLHYNKLSGSIPSQLGSLTSLYYLYLNNNALRGEIPESLGTMKNLRQLFLQMNQLSGTLPSQLGNLTYLNQLNVSINQLTGTVPPELGKLKNLTLLDLSTNLLTGIIPTELGQLTNLSQLQLDRNSFTGSIPESFDNLKNIESLTLSSNQLTGIEASGLDTLPKLSNLSIFYNNLTFEDLENKSDRFYSYVYYSPQYLIGQSMVVSVDTGANYTLNITCGGSNNRYQWFLNDKPLGAPNVNSNYLLVNITEEKVGQYHCLVTSSLVPDLVLQSEPIVIQFKPLGEYPPTDIILSNSAIDENQPAGSLIGKFKTEDYDFDDFHVYSLVDGDGSSDNTLFFVAVDQLRTYVTFDYKLKNSYSIRVQTKDRVGNTFEKTFNIAVNDLVEIIPTDIVLSNNSVDENLSPGTLVGSLTTVSGDSLLAEGYTYSLIEGEGSNDNNSFYLIDNQLKTLQLFEYSKKSSYTIRVQTKDRKGNSFEKTFEIRINSKDKLPPYDILLSSNTIDENQPLGLLIGTFSTYDSSSNPSEQVTYSLVNGEGDANNSSFFIAADQLHANMVFNYEIKKTYTIRVQTEDALGNSFQKSFTIDVNDLDDTQTITIPDAFTPNGDGINDLFVIPGMENFPNSQLTIYNRYGKQVYSATNYGFTTDGSEPVWWNGCLNANGEISKKVLPEGFYFVVITIDLNRVYKKTLFLKE